MKSFVVFSDGGSRGNPGPAAIGFVIRDEGGEILYKEGRAIGVSTNNCAEYTALKEALKKAVALGAKEVSCFLDSELVVRQLNGQYKVRDVNIKKYFGELQDVLSAFTKASFNHIGRDKNFEADKLVNQALDS
jgi:ribonuclease HI